MAMLAKSAWFNKQQQVEHHDLDTDDNCHHPNQLCCHCRVPTILEMPTGCCTYQLHQHQIWNTSTSAERERGLANLCVCALFHPRIFCVELCFVCGLAMLSEMGALSTRVSCILLDLVDWFARQCCFINWIIIEIRDFLNVPCFCFVETSN